MNSQLFLIIVVIIVLVIIHRTSSNMPVVQESANSVPIPVPVKLPQLENIFKNVLSNSMPVASNSMPTAQEPFTGSYNLNKLHEVLEKLYKSNGQDNTITKSPIAMRLLQLAIRKNKNNIDRKYNDLVSKIEKINIRAR
jgi:hypothetical protein